MKENGTEKYVEVAKDMDEKIRNDNVKVSWSSSAIPPRKHSFL